MDLTEERLDSREVFRGHIVTLTVYQVRCPMADRPSGRWPATRMGWRCWRWMRRAGQCW